MYCHLAAVLILVFTVRTLEAQDVPISHSLDSGTVIRLTWGKDHPVVGRLMAPLGPDSRAVVFCRYPGPPCGMGSGVRPQVRPAQDLVRVEVQRGSRAARGALWGAGIAIAVLGLGQLAVPRSDTEARWTAVRVAGAVTFVALSSGMGALIGRRSARWVTLP